MNALILNEQMVAALQTLNASGDPAKQIIPVLLLDGTQALNADLLSDCSGGGTWDHYRELLETLPTLEVPAEELQTVLIA